jgi:hypothetical protein
MQMKTRSLNKGERYACAPKDAKALFSDDNIHISFGALGRDHRFDGRDQSHPQIAGVVIASLGVNRRETVNSREGILAFYVIRDPAYGPDDRKAFAEDCLPQLRARYLEAISEDAPTLPGVHVTLVEWAGGGFKVHSYRYV